MMASDDTDLPDPDSPTMAEHLARVRLVADDAHGGHGPPASLLNVTDRSATSSSGPRPVGLGAVPVSAASDVGVGIERIAQAVADRLIARTSATRKPAGK